MDCQSFDGQVVRPPSEFVEAARDYVCVRVTDMSGIDVELFRFDFDLTFAVLLMNADGTIYHRYGNRDPESADVRMSMVSLVRLMKETLADHASYAVAPAPPAVRPARTVNEMWTQAGAGKAPQCFHCHMVNQASREIERLAGRVSPEEIWKYPLPETVGLTLDVDDAVRAARVESGGAAAKAGMRPGDRLVQVGETRVRSQADVQWALNLVSGRGGPLAVGYERDGTTAKATLRLAAGWNRVDPFQVSWRHTMWSVVPMPGFGGPALSAEEKKSLGLAADAFAFRIQHFLAWGPTVKYGQNAQRAGLKKGDVVLGADGRSDFRSPAHFQAWFRLTRKPGSRVVLQVARGGKPQRISLDVIP